MNTENMGIGNTKVTFSSKRRWTLEGEFPEGKKLPHSFVKVKHDKSVLNETDETLEDVWYKLEPKGDWGELTTTYYSVEPDDLQDVYPILVSFYEWREATDEANKVELFNKKAGRLFLSLYLGDGSLCEEWRFIKCWPFSVHFGDLYYGGSDEVKVEILWKYKEAWWRSHAPHSK